MHRLLAVCRCRSMCGLISPPWARNSAPCHRATRGPWRWGAHRAWYPELKNRRHRRGLLNFLVGAGAGARRKGDGSHGVAAPAARRHGGWMGGAGAGLDVHKRQITVCTQVPGEQGRSPRRGGTHAGGPGSPWAGRPSPGSGDQRNIEPPHEVTGQGAVIPGRDDGATGVVCALRPMPAGDFGASRAPVSVDAGR